MVDPPGVRRAGYRKRSALRDRVWRASDGCCELCGAVLTVDLFDLGHRLAVIDGGSDEISNLRVECRPCNRGAGGRMASARRWAPRVVGADDGVPAAVGASEWAPPLLVLGHDGPPGGPADVAAAERAIRCGDDEGLVLPLYSTPIVPTAGSRADEIRALAEIVDLDLLPWQRWVVRVGTEIDDAGLPTHRTVGVSVGRQQGKTTLLAVVVLDALVAAADAGRRAVVIWVGSDFSGLLAIWRDAILPIWDRSGIDYRFVASGDARVETEYGVVHLRGGQSKLSGVGSTADMVVLDECWSLDADVEAAATPVIRARPAAQIWAASSYAPATSGWWMGRTSAGRRESELARLGRRVAGWAYCEWGAPPGLDVHDESTWLRSLPAVDDPRAGVSLGIMRAEHSAVAESTWVHALLNRRPAVGGSPAIDTADWAACVVDGPAGDPLAWLAAAGGVSLGVDATPVVDGTAQFAAIVGVAGNRAAVLQTGEGVAWIPDALAVIAERTPLVEICCLRGSAVGPVMVDLDSAPTDFVDQVGLVAGCVGLHEAIRARELVIHDPGGVLTAAAHVAVGRSQRAGGWAYMRASADGPPVTALLGLVLAHRSASDPGVGVQAFLVRPALVV